MARALSVNDILTKKMRLLTLSQEWADAFGSPERTGVWFVWGASGNGKTSFVMQLCKELARHGKVAYNSLEEGAGATMQNALMRHGMRDVSRRFMVLDAEPMEEMEERMNRRQSPDFYVIDSFQYTGMSYDAYRRFKAANPGKLLIFISQAKGKMPEGAAAVRVMYDASLKIYVEGFRAISKGRFMGPKGFLTVWKEGAERYWGAAGVEKHNKNNIKTGNNEQEKRNCRDYTPSEEKEGGDCDPAKDMPVL